MTSPEDFMPNWDKIDVEPEKQSLQDMKRVMKMIASISKSQGKGKNG